MKLKNEVTNVAKNIYTALGAGYDEGVYHSAFEVEMRLRGINYEAEKPVQVMYKDHYVGVLYADIYVWRGDEKVLIEFKATGSFTERAQKTPDKMKEIAQVDHYFKQLDLPDDTVVLLINFPFPATNEPDIISVN
jgi:GxxExxY protein